jgi:hypothetical protein
VIVGDENVRVRKVPCAGGSSSIPQHAQARSAIEDKLRAIGGNQFEAGRVPAVAPGGRVDRRRGTSDTPKAQLGDGNRHLSPRTGRSRQCSARTRVVRKLCSMLAVKCESVNEIEAGRCQTA